MTATPLQDGLLGSLRAARRQEWAFIDGLDAAEREAGGTPEAPSIKELVADASARRRYAAGLIRDFAAGRAIDDCADPEVTVPDTWRATHRDAHEAMTELFEAVQSVTEVLLAANPRTSADHPQYLWRDAFIYGARGPVGQYAEYFARTGRPVAAVDAVRQMHDAVRATQLPPKATSDTSYDLACVLAKVGRPEEAMELLPEAFTSNDPTAVPVLKAWAQKDPDLAGLRDREDFRRLVAV